MIAGREPLNPGPVSPGPDRDGPVSMFTIQPTEEDLRRMQSSRVKNGYIKRPLNAFMVWSNIHRFIVRKSFPSMIHTSVTLGSEWSKLSQDQKRPYFEVAQKLKELHMQEFPDYVLCPKRKRGTACLSPSQAAGQAEGQAASQAARQAAQQAAGQAAQQAEGQAVSQAASQAAGKAKGQAAQQAAQQTAQQDPGVSSSVSQARPPSQSELLVPSMFAWPILMPCAVHYYPFPSSYQYQPLGLYSRVQSHCSRFCCGCTNASSSMEEAKNYHNTHPQGDEAAVAVPTREHRPAGIIHEVLTGSTTPSESREQPDVFPSEQFSSNYDVACKYEDEIDVVGL